VSAAPSEVQALARVINRAGLICINPPAGFLDRCLPALLRLTKTLRPLMIRPTCPRRRGAAYLALNNAAVRVDWYASTAGGLEPDQALELRTVAADLLDVAEKFTPVCNG